MCAFGGTRPPSLLFRRLCRVHLHGITVSAATVSRYLSRRGLVTPDPAKRPRPERVRAGATKSRSGARSLPLDDALVAALKALKARQATELLAAGPAYERSGYVAADELGRPVHPEWYTDEFRRVSDRAKVRRIRLHESRHTALSLMEKADVPVSILAAWAGHYSGAFTMSQYVHANPDDLAAGRDALSAIYRMGEPS